MLKQQKEILARHVSLFQKEGEGRWESWTPSPSIVQESLSPAPCFSKSGPSALPTLLPQTQGFRHPGPPSRKAGSPYPCPLSHPL